MYRNRRCRQNQTKKKMKLPEWALFCSKVTKKFRDHLMVFLFSLFANLRQEKYPLWQFHLNFLFVSSTPPNWSDFLLQFEKVCTIFGVGFWRRQRPFSLLPLFLSTGGLVFFLFLSVFSKAEANTEKSMSPAENGSIAKFHESFKTKNWR